MASPVKCGAIIFIVTLIVGAGMGLLPRSEGRSTKSQATSKARPTGSRDRSRENRPRWSSEDFLKRAQDTVEARAHPLATELANWTDAEIEVALNETLSKPEWLLEGSPLSKVAFELLTEWMKRDFDAAYAWFMGIQGGKAKNTLAGCLAAHWPKDRPAEGLALLRIYPDLATQFGWERGQFSLRGLQDVAAKDGAMGVAQLLREMKEEDQLNQPGYSEALKLPDGFDFNALAATDAFKEGWGSLEVHRLMIEWLETDKETALKWLLDSKGPAGVYDVISHGGLSTAASYVVGQIGTWSQSDRSEFLTASARKMSEMEYYRTASQISRWAKATGNPVAADEIRALGIQGIFYGQAANMLPLLNDMEQERRVDALLEATPIAGNSGRGMRTFTESDEALFRKQLSEWEVPSEQADEIIQRFKP
ncbi:hypothetical protein JIN85_11760 [Luteolibacter pohnpeiensis]|uniref:Uncharacterized protein n=1 Tax=Luteolibacter pohnpeiensis TaxID=454153 RepID=A0A934S927_9BACT|nr:hypothetical protein [Luteolibacter pohnpeiensis]MBK1883096.1 hypothetical protein [Luteolibacter pohnpeiensis]